MLASNKTNKQKKVQTQNHHTTKRKNKTKLCIPNSLQKENTEVIYERVLSAGAKFRIFSTLCTLQTPTHWENSLTYQKIHHWSHRLGSSISPPKIAVNWGTIT